MTGRMTTWGRRAAPVVAVVGAIAGAGGCAPDAADAGHPLGGARAVAGNRPTGPSRPAPAATSGAALADLSAHTDGLRLAGPVDGIRHGDLIVTIRNNGPAQVRQLHFSVEVPESMTRDAGDWSGCTRLASHRVGFPAGAICVKDRLGPGETATFRLGMSSPAARDGADSRISRWLVDVWAGGPGGERQLDARPDDNRRIFAVRRD